LFLLVTEIKLSCVRAQEPHTIEHYISDEHDSKLKKNYEYNRNFTNTLNHTPLSYDFNSIFSVVCLVII